MTLVLLLIIILLLLAMLYAHRKHQDALTELRDALTALHGAFNKLVDKPGDKP